MAEEIYENPTEETAIAPINATGTIVSFSDTLMQDVTEQGYWASFPVETMEDKKVLYSARNDNELLKDHMGEVLPLVGIVIDTQVINDPTVGAKTVPCVHLITEGGTVYQSASGGVVRSACEIISSFGMPETWGEALEVACKETTTAKGYRFKYLAVV